MVVAMLYTFLADVTPVASRATVFFQIAAAFLVSGMIAAPIAGAIMIYSDWLALNISLSLMLLCLPVCFAFPETLQLHAPGLERARQERADRQADGQSADSGEDRGGGDFTQDSKHSALRILWSKARDSVADVGDFVLNNKSLALLMLSAMFVILGKFVTEMLMQYATKRYGWSWSKATLLLTVRSAASLATLLVLLPVASWVCVGRLGMSGVSKDLWLARFSGVLGVVGCLMIAIADNGYMLCFGLVWMSLGAGMSQLTRSLLSALTEEHHVGTVNSLITFMELAGAMLAGPVLAKSLSVGMSIGGFWIGIPFFAAAGFLAIATAIVFIFRLPARTR